MFNKKFTTIGYSSWYDKVLIDGSLDNMDFVAFYCSNGQISKVVGTPSQQKKMAILHEAFRLNQMPPAAKIEANIGDPTFFVRLESAIRVKWLSNLLRNIIRVDATESISTMPDLIQI